MLITSVESNNGNLVYARSDLRDRGWVTIIFAVNSSERNILNAVAGSISRGNSPPIILPPNGELDEGIKSLRAALSAPEQVSDSAFNDFDGIRSAMLAGPKQVDPSSEVAPPAVEASPSPDGVSPFPKNDPAAKTMPKTAPDAVTPAEPQLVGAGSAFRVSESGDFLTNAHVVKNCSLLKIDGQAMILIAADQDFDLALIKGEASDGTIVAKFLARPAALNSDITTAGFPLTGMLSGLNVTRGSVTSLKGLGSDATRMQISAPVQPGNSGGPVVDKSGEVVGVVVAKLNAQYVADTTGDIPQNVNFAVRGEIAKLFLFQNGVEPLVEFGAGEPQDPVETAKYLDAITRLVECYSVKQ